jgi:N-acetyl-anhydromuramyl-L-alanine amidase AmpD
VIRLAAIAVALVGAGTPAPHATKPRIVTDPISYGDERRAQMAAYSERHYGEREWRLRDRKAIVLHFTGIGGYRSAWNTFESNVPNLGELPGVCSHYVIKQGGTIAELVPPRIRCRHTIGMNHVSIGIEFVQSTGPGSHWADRQILEREPQIRAGLRLVRWLRARFEIPIRDVIGHAMANDSRWFEDRQGWRNDHTDWLARDVRTFRKLLRRLER